MAKYVGENSLAELVTKTKALVATKQNTLTAGTGITISNNVISSSGGVNVDSALSSSSTNPVQNSVLNSAFLNKADKDASNITASTWKTALSLDNVENYKIVTGSFLAKSNPTTVNTGLTTVVGFCAMIQMNQTTAITSYYPLLHQISNGAAKVSLRQTSNGAINTSGSVYIRYIAFGT